MLRAQAARAASEIAFYTALVRYNQAINQANYRRGVVLDVNNISLAEGEWYAEAQDDALRRAWARSHAFPADHLDTEPEEFSSPVPYPKTDLYPGHSTDEHAKQPELVSPAPDLPEPTP